MQDPPTRQAAYRALEGAGLIGKKEQIGFGFQEGRDENIIDADPFDSALILAMTVWGDDLVSELNDDNKWRLAA